MIQGIDLFAEYFSDYKEQYTLIGGSACELLMNNAGLDFRATKDIDMVLIVDALTKEFGERFWSFIVDGDYEVSLKKEDNSPKFYRFTNKSNIKYPKMIELFSRPQNGVILKCPDSITPIHIDDDVSSLSAILLDDDYYSFIKSGTVIIDGVTILDEEHLIPLKMKAWLDMKESVNSGVHVDSKDIRKHKNDVFRLFSLIDRKTVTVPESICKDINDFLDSVKVETIDLEAFGVSTPKESAIDILRAKYITESR